MFTVSISTGNAAFTDQYTGEPDVNCEAAEVTRILKTVIEDIEDGRTSGSCIDINGNNVGKWRMN